MRDSNRNSNRVGRFIGICIALAASSGLACAHSSIFDPMGKTGSLEEAQRKYTELVRWGEIERASAYVDPDQVDAYLDEAMAFEGIRFTDFETSKLSFGEDENSATVFVVYHAYSMRTLTEKRIRERQDWYREEGMSNVWRVRPDLRHIVAGVTGR